MRNNKSNNAELVRIYEMMLQNIQSSKKQNVNRVQFTIVETVLRINLRGKHEGEFYMEAKGNYLN